MLIKIILITGNELRHRYFAHKCASYFDLAKVYFEQKANVHEKFDLNVGEKEIMDKHFQLRTKSEEQYFGAYIDVSKLKHSFLTTGESNSIAIFDQINKFAPDYIILFGSSLIKDPLLSGFENRIINIHLGLSPYYRGSGTNFWPLVHNKPECIGATIHLATSLVDAGMILQQVRPHFVSDDTIHDIGNKTIIAAAEVLQRVIELYDQHKIELNQQNLTGGFVCKRKDLNAADIKLLYDNFDKGMIGDYLEKQSERNNNYSIVDQFNVNQ